MSISSILKKRWAPVFLLIIAVVLFHGVYYVQAVLTDDEVLDVSAVVPAPNQPTPTGGGSGGGVNNTTSAATVTLSGFSYPNSKLILLKDGQLVTTLVTGADGSFQITVNNLTFGNYQFSLYAENSDGGQSNTTTVNVAAFTTSPYQYTGLLIAPTLAIAPTTVRIGDTIHVSGNAIANSTVFVEIPNVTAIGTTVANSAGQYQFDIAVAVPAGTINLRARSKLATGEVSPYSRPVTILVYGTNQPPPDKPPVQYGACVDYNKNGRVNLIDFSILLFWFGKVNPPAEIDCNGDHVIDIKDFSILMYFWTG